MGERIRKAMQGALGALALGAATLSIPDPAQAGWQQQASAADAQRLAQLPAIRAQAIHAAMTWKGQGDLNELRGALEPEGRTIPAGALVGNWRCREIKLGGISPYIVYRDWFRCTVRRANGGLLFRKVTGTQRTAGYLYPRDGAWVYLGASSAKNEPWHQYSGRSPSLGAEVTPDDQIGLLTGIGNNHLRLEIPAVQESLLDVIELRR
ncbi:MAG: DUF4893 domain-containing protein [Alphaproteobacteria bacterium]|nr:DUF4893 domain-containing protein [Alphaproteobacteria bacterium]